MSVWLYFHQCGLRVYLLDHLEHVFYNMQTMIWSLLTEHRSSSSTFLSMDTSLVLKPGIMVGTLVARPHRWLLNLLPIKLWVTLFCNPCCTLLCYLFSFYVHLNNQLIFIEWLFCDGWKGPLPHTPQRGSTGWVLGPLPTPPGSFLSLTNLPLTLCKKLHLYHYGKWKFFLFFHLLKPWNSSE